MRSVTVGTSTSAFFTVSASSAAVMGLSSRLRRASKSSRMRVSMLSGSLRVTTTRGFLRLAMVRPSPPRQPANGFLRSGLFNPHARHWRSLRGLGSLCNRWTCEDKGLHRGRRGPLARANRYPMSFFRRREAMNSKRSWRIVRRAPVTALALIAALTCAALPVEITAESDNWRRIRDWEGSEGWVYHSLLSGRRTAVVTPKDKKELVPLYEQGDSSATVIARLQAGVLAAVKRCTGSWCRIAGAGFDGWVVQEQLWGVYPNEKVE